jgi:tetratricopeptide (TPR) repeat protein
MVAKRRIRKHELKEDRFVTTTFRVTSMVRENQSTFLTVLAALVVLVIVIVVLTSGRSQTHEAAAQLMGEADMLYQIGRYREAIQQCQIVLDQHGKTREAGLAAFFSADSHYKLGDYQQALEAFKLYVDKYHYDPLLVASSLTGLAACHEQLGHFADAGEFYRKAADQHLDFYAAPEALMSAGRCFFTSGDFEQAIEAYNYLVENFPESRYSDQAKMLSAEIHTKALKALSSHLDID